ncbi:MAG: hypothetical protein JNJ73_17280 [Hyphomonadaceae bacterium]|nr:hypothetical protein [Hyphomonadaceae bacterium]
MLRRTFLLGAAALSACGPSLPAVPPERVVDRIYDPYRGRGEGGRMRLQNAAPWTDDLKNMIAAADRRAVQTGKTWIEVDPFLNARDVEVGQISATADAPPADGKATVTARFTLSGQPGQVTYDLVVVGKEWRVANIRGENYNLEAIAARGVVN